MPKQDLLTALLADLPPQPTPEQLVEHVTHIFEQLANPEDAEGVSRYMPGMDNTYGLRVPQMRAVGKSVAKAYKKDPELCRAIARTSWPRGSREHRLFAAFLLDSIKLTPAERWALGLEFLPGVRTWEDCDQLCAAVSGRALAEDPAYMDQVETWLTNANFWVRRAALVSTVYLRRAKYPPDLARALSVRALAMCAALLGDPEPYVHKAIDWATREVIGQHYDLARDWLLDQARQGLSGKARSTLKLSAKKLNEADREAFLAALEGR